MSDGDDDSKLFCALGSTSLVISKETLREHLYRFLDEHGAGKKEVMLLPPDYTRCHSQAGIITQMICEYYKYIPREEEGEREEAAAASAKVNSAAKEEDGSDGRPSISILPCLGTHAPMTEAQIRSMFGNALADKYASGDENPFLVHDWRNDVVTIGHVPPDIVQRAISTSSSVSSSSSSLSNIPLLKDKDSCTWPAQLNKHVWNKRGRQEDVLVLSIGQVVPHEVMGMANYNKNLLVGAGGVQAIHLSHFIGALWGMERMMGRADNPLRDILNYASDTFLESQLNLWYLLTVVATHPQTGAVEWRGFFLGNTRECFHQACQLSLQVNLTMVVPRPPRIIVAHMAADEFHSTWVANKAIYRTRLAIARGQHPHEQGHLYIIAPGVAKFGEDAQVDALIRQYGYRGTPAILQALSTSEKLQQNLSAAAHLIHGSSEGEFQVTYCPSASLTREDVEGVGYHYASMEDMKQKFPLEDLRDGWNEWTDPQTGLQEEIYYISNPALGLWSVPSRFEQNQEATKDNDHGKQSQSNKQAEG